MPLGTIGLATHLWNSRIKSLCLVALFPLISLWLFWWQIYFAVLFFHLRVADTTHAIIAARTDDLFYGWAGLAFIAALSLWFWYSWREHASIIRGFCISSPVTAQQEPHLCAMLDALAISQGLPTPELDIVETSARNSFVCDIDGELSRVFVTRGLLENLATDEVEAVLAHEIAHLLNGDNRLISFSIAFTNLYPFIIDRITPHGSHEAPADNTSFNPLFLHPMAILFLAPVWGGHFIISFLRVILFMHRELEADAMAYDMTKNADALMRALIRISKHARIPFSNQAIRFICIDNPIGGLYSTHPRLSTRLEALHEISNIPVPDIARGTPAPAHRKFQKGTTMNAPLINRFMQPDRTEDRFAEE